MAVKEIIEMGNENSSKKEIYKMTHSNQSVSIKDIPDGTVINPMNYVKYIDVNSKNEENEVLSIMDEDGTIYTTISSTFKREFDDMTADFELDFELVKISGTTRAGREFVSCELA